MTTPPTTDRRTLYAALALTLAILLIAVFNSLSIAEKIADHLAVKSLQHEHDVVLFEGDLAAFRGCLLERGGNCAGNAATALAATLTATGAAAAPGTKATPARGKVGSPVAESIDRLPAGHPAKLARDVLDDPTLGQGVDLHNQLRGHGSGGLRVGETDGACTKIHLPVSVAYSTALHDKIHRATAAGGWDALQKHTEQLLAASNEGDPGHEQKVTEARKARFLKTYVDAFFGNGHVVSVDLTVAAAIATTDLAKELEKHAKLGCKVFNARAAVQIAPSCDPGDAAQAAAAEQASASCGALAQSIYKTATSAAGKAGRKLFKVAQHGFISRDGSFQAQLPSVAVDVNPLASPMISLHASPSKPNHKFDFTAVGTDLVRVVLEAIFDAYEGLPAVASASGAGLLPAIPADVDTRELNLMSRVNDNAEVATAVVVDRVVKGIGPFSLNNKALEDLITTVIATSVRKAAEKASWCWFSCRLDQATEALAADAAADAGAEAKKIEDGARRDAYGAAERLCLALSVDA